MMIGGKRSLFKKVENLFEDMCVKDGYGYMGDSGSGHFVKMVHNGIEYGMMQAIAEGFAVMKKSPFKLDMKTITNVYSHGSVIESSLVKWIAGGFKKFGVNMKGVSGSVASSGEGLWTVQGAKKLQVPTPIIEGALKFRTASQKNPSYTGKLIAAMRNQFGGHDIK